MGSNDKYLVAKLRSYNITLDTIDTYLGKLVLTQEQIRPSPFGQTNP